MKSHYHNAIDASVKSELQDYTDSDPWRVLRIQGEIVEGFVNIYRFISCHDSPQVINNMSTAPLVVSLSLSASDLPAFHRFSTAREGDYNASAKTGQLLDIRVCGT